MYEYDEIKREVHEVETQITETPETYNRPRTTNRPRQHRKRKRKNLRILATGICCLAIGGGIGIAGYQYLAADESNIASAYESIVESIAPAINLNSVSGNTLTPSELYAENVESCVGITVSNVYTNAFGQVSATASSGSGFVITSDGYIVTNHHVIADVIEYETLTIDVSFYNGDSYPATLIGYEEDNDVALLKIDAKNLDAVSLGDSDDLDVGEIIYAIGNPLGELTFSLTDGLVSALDRLVSTSEGTTMNMFQTNTAINPGNSGGPIFNASGDVVGIAAAKYSSSGSGTTVEGLSFAIPINDVVDILADLKEYGYVTGKPYLGVQVTNASSFGQTYGAAISFIAEGSAAEKAGLLVGDVVTALDDTSIDNASALTAAITAYSAGDSVTLTINRDGEVKKLTAVFDEKNEETESANQIIIQQETSQEHSRNSMIP